MVAGKEIDHYLNRHQSANTLVETFRAHSQDTISNCRTPITGVEIQSLRRQVLWIDEWLEVIDTKGSGDVRIAAVDFTDLKDGAECYFRRLLDFFEIDEALFDFSTLPVKPQEGQHHFRKGETDEWRHVFSPEQIDMANSLMTPRLLERYGP